VTLGAPGRTGPLIYALLAVALGVTWQALTVRYNYGGKWTGLFCTGANLPPPPALAWEHIYRFPNSSGYDGQFYHYVAHDPLFRFGLNRYIDAPRLRWRRILIPALAYMAATGLARHIDAAYIAVTLLFLLAGVYWLGRFIRTEGFHPVGSLLFLLVPATVVSLDRLTIDAALAALCVGFALYVKEGRPGKVYLILVLAPLVRETGLLLIAAYSLAELSGRHLGRAVLFATSVVPALAWYGFVHSRTAPHSVTGWFTAVPLAGLAGQMVHPVHYPVPAVTALTWIAFDELALAGMLLAFITSFWLIRQKWLRPLQFAAVLLVLGGLNLGEPFWVEAYAFGRIFSPLLLLLALFGCCSRSWIALLPAAMVVPRVCIELGGQIVNIARRLFA